MVKKTFFGLLFVLALTSCAKKNDLKPLSLLDYGIPLTIMAPDSASIKHEKLAIEEDITITAPASNYKLQIFISEATYSNPSKLVEEQKGVVKQNPYFTKITDEYPDGFIFESNIDSTKTFGFRRVKIMGDKEIIFREALLGTFSKEDIERMYHAVEGVKRKKK